MTDGLTEPLRERLERLENYYDFSCEGGPLKWCREWQELKELLAVISIQLAADVNDAYAEGVKSQATEQRRRITSLLRYQECDVVRRSSMTEYLNAEDVEEALDYE